MYQLTITLIDGQIITRPLNAGIYKIGSDSDCDLIIFSQNMKDQLCLIECDANNLSLQSEHINNQDKIEHETQITRNIDGVTLNLIKLEALPATSATQTKQEFAGVNDNNEPQNPSKLSQWRNQNWRSKAMRPQVAIIALSLALILCLLSFSVYHGILWLSDRSGRKQIAQESQKGIGFYLSKLSSYYELIEDDDITYIFVKDQKVRNRIKGYVEQKSLLNHEVILIDDVLHSAKIITSELSQTLKPHSLKAQNLNILGSSNFKQETLLKHKLLSAFPMLKSVSFNQNKQKIMFDLSAEIAAIYYDKNPHIILKNKQKYQLFDTLPNGMTLIGVYKDYLQVRNQNKNQIIRGF